MLNHNLNLDIFGILLSDPEQASTTNGVPSYVFALSSARVHQHPHAVSSPMLTVVLR